MRSALVVVGFVGACCADASMSIVSGPDDHLVRPGDVIQFRATGFDWEAGPDHCGSDWAVNHVIGGTPEVGVIDGCGRYVAPAVLPANLELVLIEAASYPLDAGCADCCPYAALALEPVR